MADTCSRWIKRLTMAIVTPKRSQSDRLHLYREACGFDSARSFTVCLLHRENRMAHRPLEDWEYPEPDDDEEMEVSETLPCPSCGEPVYEDTEECPYCGEYVSWGSSSPLAGRPWWYVVLAIFGIVATIFLLIGF